MEPTRRDILGGLLVSIAAPYVVRTSGLLMPIRDRTLLSARELAYQTMWGLRDYRKYPPTVTEVREWRRGMSELLSRCTVSWTAEGFNRIMVMSEAEKRYQAIGLL